MKRIYLYSLLLIIVLSACKSTQTSEGSSEAGDGEAIATQTAIRNEVGPRSNSDKRPTATPKANFSTSKSLPLELTATPTPTPTPICQEIEEEPCTGEACPTKSVHVCLTVDPNDGPCGKDPCPTVDPNDGPCGKDPCPEVNPDEGPCGKDPCPSD